MLPANERANIAGRALELARAIDNDTRRTRAVAALAPCLSPELAVQALKLLGSMTRLVLWPSLLDALDSVAPQLPEAVLPYTLKILKDIPLVAGDVIWHVTRLLDRLGRTHVLRDHFKDPRGPQWDPQMSWLWAIAPFLPTDLAEEALQVARDQPTDARRLSLAALAPRLPSQAPRRGRP